MSLTKASKVGLLISLSTSVVILLIAGLLYLNRQFVSDSLVTFFFAPSAAIRAIEERVDFSDEGTRIFYATQPELAGAEFFNTKCPRQEQKSPIIGCYTAQDRVYIYDVTNDDLDGIEEVTAAHEMLHAAWVRLSNEERERVSALLDAAYDTLVKDTEIRERMDYYKRTEPGELHNELHSILGTEVQNIGSELEAYYARYFTDRQIVVSLHKQYHKMYEALYAQSDELYQKMQVLSEKITKNKAAYDREAAQLTQEINSFNYRANTGNFSSMSAFYAERASLMSRSNALEQKRTALNNDIDTYNALHEQYVEVASKIEILNKSLDSFESVRTGPTV